MRVEGLGFRVLALSSLGSLPEVAATPARARDPSTTGWGLGCAWAPRKVRSVV